MAVYVDPSLWPYKRMVMCHLWADTPEELHAMADRIGVARRWFQHPPKASWNHYDICKNKRALAVAAGAIETDREGALEWLAKRNGDHSMLERIARRRQMRADHPSRVEV